MTSFIVGSLSLLVLGLVYRLAVMVFVSRGHNGSYGILLNCNLAPRLVTKLKKLASKIKNATYWKRFQCTCVQWFF